MPTYLPACSLAQHWLGPRDTSGTHYGPEWKTLALQDRSVWDADRIQDFPRTVGAMQRLRAPSCEAFFAKQVCSSLGYVFAWGMYSTHRWLICLHIDIP